MKPLIMKEQVSTKETAEEMHKWKMVAWIALRCCLSPKEMWISSNCDEIEAFNDIIFRNGRQTFMLQFSNAPENLTGPDILGNSSLVKHGNGINKIREACISQNAEKSSVNRFLGEFHEIYFVLLLNSNITPCKYVEICYGDNFLNFLDTSDNNSIYKIDLKNATNLNCYNFYLLANQIKNFDFKIMEELEKLTKVLNLVGLDIKKISDDFIKFLQISGPNKVLGMQDILNKLFELLVCKFELKFGQGSFYFGNNAEINIWDEIIRNRRIIVIDFDEDVFRFLFQWLGNKLEGFLEESKKFWVDCLNDNEKNYFLQESSSDVQKINLLDVYKRLWMDKEIPLLLEVNQESQYEEIKSLIKFANYSFKVIILNKSKGSLVPLEESEKSWDNIENILLNRAKFPGGTEILGDLYRKTIFRVIKSNDIINILLGKLKCNYFNPSPTYFINRTVTKILLKLEVLEKIQDEIFIIEGTQGKLTVKCLEQNCSLHNIKLNELHYCNVISIKCAPEVRDLNKLKRLNIIIHRVTFHDSNYLQWIASYGSVDNLKPFCVEAEGETKNLHPLSIISAPPGGGKTFFLDHMALKAPNKWVIKIDLNEHVDYYKTKNCDDILTNASQHIDYFKKFILEQNKSELNQYVFEYITGYDIQEKLILIFLKFHEVSAIYREKVINIIKSIREEGYSVWISTRPHLRSYLEEQLDTFSISLKEFSPEAQTEFLLKENLTRDSILNVNGIPLYLKLLGELPQGCKNYDLMSLYENFIKNRLDLEDLLCEDHSRFALIRLFPLEEELLRDIREGLEAYYDGDKNKTEALEKFGLLRLKKIGDDLNIRFLHHTVADFLAAHWIFKNFTNSKELIRILTTKRFCQHYNLLFYFFDALILKKFPLHSVLINKNIQESESIMDANVGQIAKVDPCGRTILHIIGLYYDDSLNNHDQCRVRKIMQKIPEIVLKPDIFGYTPLDYALGNGALNIADKMCEKWGLQITSVALDMLKKTQYLADCANFDYQSLMTVFLEYFSFNDVLQVKTKYPYDLQQSDYFAMINNHDYYFKSVFSGKSLNINYKIQTHSKYNNLNWNESHYYDLRHAIVFDFKLERDRLMLKASERNREDGFGLIPLHYAILCKNIEALRILLLKNSSLNHQDAFGNTPLHLAIGCSENWKFCERKKTHLIEVCGNKAKCEEIHLKMASELLLKGSEINLRNRAGDSPLHIALYAKNFKIAELLIVNNADVNIINAAKRTALHLAAEYGNYDFFCKILLQGADLNIQDNQGETPIFSAIRNSIDMVELLICKGSNPTITNKIGKYPHDIAFDQSLLKLSNFLFNLKHKNIDLTESISSEEENPLFRAVNENNYEGVKNLICNGADVNLQNKNGQTVLHLAAKHSSYNILREILNKSSDINKQDIAGWAPLFYAVESNRSSSSWLIYKGADVNLVDKKGRTLLHTAAKNNDFHALKELLRESFKNINKLDIHGCSPLYYAVSENNEKSTLLLITYGANVNVTDKNNQTLLHIAAKNNNTEILKELLHKKNIEINIQDSEGYTPLLYAIEANNNNNKNLLMVRGAKVDLANNNGETCLHLAAKNGDNFTLNEFLSKAVFKIDLRSKNGWTALFYAVAYNHMDSVKLIIGYQADTHIKDKNGETVFHIARKSCFDEIFEELLKHKVNTKCKECNAIRGSDFLNIPSQIIVER